MDTSIMTTDIAHESFGEYKNRFYRWREWTDSAGGKYTIDESNPSIATKTDDEPCTLRGCTPFPPNMATYVGFNLLKLTSNDSVSIGVKSLDENADGSWCFDCEKLTLFSGLPHKYKDKEYGPKKESGVRIFEGGTLGLIMDTTTGELSFVVNEVCHGVAYKGIPLDRPLVPCFTLTSADSSIEICFPEFTQAGIPLPTNIMTKNDTWNSSELSWDSVEGASFYQVEVNGSEFLEATASTSFAKVGLPSGGENVFRVRSVSKGCVSAWSENVRCKTPSIPPIGSSGWKQCPSYVDSDAKYEIESSNHKHAKRKGHDVDKYSIVLGSAPIPPNEVTSWVVKVQVPVEFFYLAIGLAPFDVCQSSNRSINIPGWYFSCFDSTVRSCYGGEYVLKDYGPRKSIYTQYVQSGDKFGVVMDTTKGEVSFTINGVNLGVAFEGIPLDKPLVPCVIFNHRWVSFDLSFTESANLNEVSSDIPVPSNVVAKNKTSGSMKISWDPVKKASMYQIEVNEGKPFYISKKNGCQLKELQPDTEYSIRVRAMKGNKVSEWSAPLKESTQSLSFECCGWKECPRNADFDHKYFVNEYNIKFATKAPWGNGICTLLGNTPFPPDKISACGIKISSLKSITIKGFWVGVVPSDINQAVSKVYKKCGWYLNCYNSTLVSGPPHNYVDKEHGPRKGKYGDGLYVTNGSMVGITMDTSLGTLSFTLSKGGQIVAYEGIPLDKPLVPCAILENNFDSVGLHVKGNKDKGDKKDCVIS